MGNPFSDGLLFSVSSLCGRRKFFNREFVGRMRRRVSERGDGKVVVRGGEDDRYDKGGGGSLRRRVV